MTDPLKPSANLQTLFALVLVGALIVGAIWGIVAGLGWLGDYMVGRHEARDIARQVSIISWDEVEYDALIFDTTEGLRVEKTVVPTGVDGNREFTGGVVVDAPTDKTFYGSIGIRPGHSAVGAPLSVRVTFRDLEPHVFSVRWSGAFGFRYPVDDEIRSLEVAFTNTGGDLEPVNTRVESSTLQGTTTASISTTTAPTGKPAVSGDVTDQAPALPACPDIDIESLRARMVLPNAVSVDTFALEHEIQGEALVLELVTDAVGTAIVTVQVHRLYYQDTDDEARVRPYFSGQGLVDDWKQPCTIRLDHAAWKADIDDLSRTLARAGMPRTVTGFRDEIEVTAHVGFPKQVLVTGAATESDVNGFFSAVDEITLELLDAELDPSGPAWADPMNLTTGKQYRLSQRTPLVVDLEPADPIAAAAAALQIEPGGTVTVLSVSQRRGRPWYQVTARQPDGARVGPDGWINSTALLGQDILEVGR